MKYIYIYILSYFLFLFILYYKHIQKNLLSINIIFTYTGYECNTFNNLIQILIKLQAIELPTLDEIKWKQSKTLLSLLHHCILFVQLQT